jgi:hypothetical protein
MSSSWQRSCYLAFCDSSPLNLRVPPLAATAKTEGRLCKLKTRIYLNICTFALSSELFEQLVALKRALYAERPQDGVRKMREKAVKGCRDRKMAA